MKQKAKPRIAFLRDKAGLTQLELSRLVGVTESTIQNWESGRTGTDHIERIVRFCQALNCKLEDLIEYVSASPEEISAKTVTSLSEIHDLLGTDEPTAVSIPKAEVPQKRKVARSNSNVS
ncbi:MAG: helix-turn-helix transcriptional regulator [Tolypothrix sp. T3-bin4]|nr:helix-turn-helix transcriptional regulator [Tolypothrix sp. Co-bin9]MBD0303521.1 helix-turn-helix transcriptional regulator [Tolypothrix sp. T3-bin4]